MCQHGDEVLLYLFKTNNLRILRRMTIQIFSCFVFMHQQGGTKTKHLGLQRRILFTNFKFGLSVLPIALFLYYRVGSTDEHVVWPFLQSRQTISIAPLTLLLSLIFIFLVSPTASPAPIPLYCPSVSFQISTTVLTKTRQTNLTVLKTKAYQLIQHFPSPYRLIYLPFRMLLQSE